MDHGLLLAIVAEYRGVAVCEARGTQRAVWHGTEYGTDGGAYLLGHSEGDRVPLLKLPSEAKAKAYLDHLGPPDLARFATYEEAWRLLTQAGDEGTLRAYLEWRAGGGHYRWDSVQGVFVRSDPS